MFIMKTEENNVIVYSNGLVTCSVCVPKNLKRKEIERLVNKQHPTGVDSSWKIDKENFMTGEKNPCACNTDENRMHYLMSC